MQLDTHRRPGYSRTARRRRDMLEKRWRGQEETEGGCMRRSIVRILVSHAGNLPRPGDLNRLLAAGESARVALTKRLPSAVAEVVERQIAGGVDIVNDGEYVKAGSY